MGAFFIDSFIVEERKLEREKKGHLKSQLSRLPQASLNRRPYGWGWLNSLPDCFFSSCVIQLAVFKSRWMLFEMNVLAIKIMMSGTYTTVKKLNVRHMTLSGESCMMLFKQ